MRELVEELKKEIKRSPEKRGCLTKIVKFMLSTMSSTRQPTMAGPSTDYSKLFYDQFAHLLAQCAPKPSALLYAPPMTLNMGDTQQQLEMQ